MNSLDNLLYPNPSESTAKNKNTTAAVIIPETPEMPVIIPETPEIPENTLEQDVREIDKNAPIAEKNKYANKNACASAANLDSLKNMQFINCNVTINISNNNSN